jgi:hypothetical protein
MDKEHTIVIAATILAVAVVTGSVIVVLYSARDDAITIIGLLLAFITATVSSMYAAFKTSQTSQDVKHLSTAVNGRITELLEISRHAAIAQGKLEVIESKLLPLHHHVNKTQSEQKP